eukprot:11163371-Ditylum_brightwellii.AAC.1
MPVYDLLLNAEVSLQLGDGVRVGKVTQRAIGPNGTVAGNYDNSPMMNTMKLRSLQRQEASTTNQHWLGGSHMYYKRETLS